MDLKKELMNRLSIPENWDKYDYQTQRYSFDDMHEVLDDIVKKLNLNGVSNCTLCNAEINYKGICEMCYTKQKLNDL